MPDLEIVIRTKAELAGAKAALDSLDKQIGAAKALGKSYADLASQRSKAAAIISSSEKSMAGGFRSAVGSAATAIGSKLGIPLGAGALTAGAVGGAVAGGGILAVREYAQAEQAVVKLDTALAQSGRLTDDYRKRLIALADQYEETTGIADEQWLGVLTKLTQFGSTEQSIGVDLEMVKNLAGLMGGDLQSAATAVARAMQGNFEMFRRYGIVLDEDASKTEKFKQLQVELAQRGGGQLDAAGRTLIGTWNKFKNAINDLLKIFGAFIERSGVLQNVMESFTWWLNKANQAGEWFMNIFGGVVRQQENLKNATKATTQTLEESEKAEKDHAKALTEVADAAEMAAGKYDELVAAADRRLKQADEEANAQMALELAMVDADEKGGRMSHVQALRARAAIRDRYAGEAFQRAQATDAEKIAALRSQIGAIKDRILELEGTKSGKTQKQKEEITKEQESLFLSLRKHDMEASTLESGMRSRAKVRGFEARTSRVETGAQVSEAFVQAGREALQNIKRGESAAANALSNVSKAFRDAMDNVNRMTIVERRRMAQGRMMAAWIANQRTP